MAHLSFNELHVIKIVNFPHLAPFCQLISHGVLTRFTREFCLIDDEYIARLHMLTICNLIIFDYLQVRGSGLKHNLKLILPFP